MESEAHVGGRQRPSLPARERNRRSILEAARQVLADDPTASIDDVAVAAGVVRRTVYGHFASRRELVVGLVEEGAREFLSGLAPTDREPDDPATELVTVVLRTWETARRFGAVVVLARHEAPDAVMAAMNPFNNEVAALIAHGQRLRVFSNPLEARVLARVMDGVAQTLLEAEAKGEWTGDASDVARTQLLMLGVSADRAAEVVAHA